MILNFELLILIIINFFYINVVMLMLNNYINKKRIVKDEVLIHMYVCFGSVVSVMHIINPDHYKIYLIVCAIILYIWLRKKINTNNIIKLLIQFYFITINFILFEKYIYKSYEISKLIIIEDKSILVVCVLLVRFYVKLLIRGFKAYMNNLRNDQKFKIAHIMRITIPFLIITSLITTHLILGIELSTIYLISFVIFVINLSIIMNFVAFNICFNVDTVCKEDYRINYYKDLISRFSTYINEVKKIKHDFKHHILVMNSIVNNQKYEILSKYIKNLFYDNNFEADNFVNTGNFLIDAIINNKFKNANSFNIKFNHNISIPKNLKIDEYEFGIVLGNILDNAIEATREIDYRKRYVDVLIKYYTSETLIILVKNTYDGKKDFTVNKTRKNDKENHGIGLKNVKDIMEKNNGFFEIKYDDNTFEVKIMFYEIGLYRNI